MLDISSSKTVNSNKSHIPKFTPTTNSQGGPITNEAFEVKARVRNFSINQYISIALLNGPITLIPQGDQRTGATAFKESMKT